MRMRTTTFILSAGPEMPETKEGEMVIVFVGAGERMIDDHLHLLKHQVVIGCWLWRAQDTSLITTLFVVTRP